MTLIQDGSIEKAKRPSGLSTAISFASLLTAAVMGAINSKVLPPLAVWICAIGFALVTAVFIAPFVTAVIFKLSTWRSRARIRRQYRGQILALCKALVPLSEQSCVYSAGNIVNPAINQKLLEPTNANAHVVALGILHDRISDLLTFESSATDHDLLRLIYGWLQSYLKVCDGLYYSIKGSPGLKEIKEGQWESIGRSWNEIRQRGTALCSDYSRISYGIRSASPHESVPEYLSPIPEFVK